MKNYLTIFGLLFKYMFKRDGQKSSKWLYLAYAIIALAYGFIVFSICSSIYTIAPVFHQLNLLAEFLTLVLAVGCVAVVIFGLIPTLNYLYFSKDTEFMLTLPVKPSTVFLAKLSVVYLTEIVVSTLLLIPCIITIGVSVSLGPVFYIVGILAVLLVPSIPMLLVMIIAIPLMFVVSFFKNKGALTSIVLIVLFGVVFGAYYLILGNLAFGGNDVVIDEQQIVLAFTSAMGTISNILFPLTAISRVATLSTSTLFGSFSLPIAVLINSAVFILTSAVLIALAILVSGIVYRKSASSMLEGNGKKEGKVAKTEQNSPFTALMKKEWRELFRNPAFAFQCLAGVIIVPIIMIFFASTMDMGIFEGLAETGEELSTNMLEIIQMVSSFIMIAFICMIGVSVNTGAATSITREGKNIYVMKTMPVPYETQIKAKLTLYVIISTLTVIASMIVVTVMNFNLINTLFGFVFILLYNYGFNCFAMLLDAHKPNLTWVTHNEAVKGKSAAIPMLINMAATIVLIAIPLVLFILIPSLIVAQIVSWIVLIAIAVAVAVVFHSLLFANINKFMERI